MVCTIWKGGFSAIKFVFMTWKIANRSIFPNTLPIKVLLERGVSQISDLGPSEKPGNFLLIFFNVNYYISWNLD